MADLGDLIERARQIHVHVYFLFSPGRFVEKWSPTAQNAFLPWIPIQWLNRRNVMGQIHPWWDSNDISHLYRSFLYEVNWVLRGLSLALYIFNCSETCSSEGSFPCLRKKHFWVWEMHAKPLTCLIQSGVPYLNLRISWSTLSIQQYIKSTPATEIYC